MRCHVTIHVGRYIFANWLVGRYIFAVINNALKHIISNIGTATVHESVLAAGDEETGCSIHLVTKEVDGGPILLQRSCPVFESDSVESLKERVQKLEGEAFIEVINNWRSYE